MRRNSQKIEVHPFEQKIANVYEFARKVMSSKNYELFERYDRVMVGDTVATSTRSVQLVTLARLTKQINKDWNLVTKEDINKLVHDIMNTHSIDGKENWTTWDNKKILRIFMRWLKFGNRDIKELEILKKLKESR